MISIVIPVRDGGEALRRLLDAIAAQRVDEPVETIVVDSGSGDGSAELCRSFGARVEEIASESFDHGGTRNRGAALARGEIVVFTVQDALPVGEGWLGSLVAPLRSDNDLAATYSRQIAREGTPPHQSFYIDFRYGPEPREQRASGPADLTPANTLFSNVSSAIRSSTLERFPFASAIATAEDLEWCSRVLLAGLAIAYVPGSVVRHSHDYTLRGLARRYYLQGIAARRSFLSDERTPPGSVRRDGLRYARQELKWMWESGKRRQIPAALVYEAARYGAFKVGSLRERHD